MDTYVELVRSGAQLDWLEMERREMINCFKKSVFTACIYSIWCKKNCRIFKRSARTVEEATESENNCLKSCCWSTQESLGIQMKVLHLDRRLEADSLSRGKECADAAWKT
ncbi:hypothetical protein Ancab_028630 [Ancistrocladus abbreviatus]